jgi:hypothetical protein
MVAADASALLTRPARIHAMPVIDLLGIAGALLVFASFWMKSTLRLRLTALASNVVFIAYAQVAWLLPILALHCALLPLNAVRLWDLVRERRRPAAPLAE